MSQLEEEEEQLEEEITLDPESELYKRYESFLVGEISEVSEEDKEELAKITYIFESFGNPQEYPKFKDLSKVNYIVDIRDLKNLEEIEVDFFYQNTQVRKILWDFSHVDQVQAYFLNEATNIESIDCSTWTSMNSICCHGFCSNLTGKSSDIKLLNAHKLTNVSYEYEDTTCCEVLKMEIARQKVEVEKRKRALLDVHLVAFKGASKISKMLQEIFVPRFVVLKFLLGDS